MTPDNAKPNQAWRKRPRQFAPKSRLGCKTCKIRRVKCDLARPSCAKCHSTGRKCDGYGDQRLPCNVETDKTDEALFTRQGNIPQIRAHIRTFLHNLGPLMILPVAGTEQARAIRFFEHSSIKNMNAYHPCSSWRNTLIYFSQTVPSVRHAAMALSIIHRHYLDRDSSGGMHCTQSSKDWLPSKTALHHYNRAIELLLNQGHGSSIHTTTITLIVCYLFTCFDQLACNYVQAVKHLAGGVALLRSINHSLANNNISRDEASGYRTIIDQVTRQIRRLDMQAVMFLVDWTPVEFQEPWKPQLSQCDRAFHSLEQAAEHIQTLVSQVMCLRNEAQLDRAARPSSSLRNAIFEQLGAWHFRFESMLQQGGPDRGRNEADPLITLMRLHYLMSCVLLDTSGNGREMDYDEFLPQFQQCLTLADEVAAAHARSSGCSTPTFTPEIGVIPVLYIIGVKCRHPGVRRKAVNILRRRPMREAVWDSISAARVVERIIVIEEGETARSLGVIDLRQRVETMSWIHVVTGQWAGRLDMSYTFCGQEGTISESLEF